MRKILIGADPEMFMRNPNTGDFVSAHGLVPGTKYEPFKVPFGAVQIDGTALEFNIDPAHTVDEFLHNIESVKSTIAGYVPGYNVVAEPVALYEEDYFNWDVPASAKELGCEPDYNGWTGEQNPRPDPGNRPFRTASGHIHIGWTQGMDPLNDAHFEECAAVARQMDYYLGIHSLLWDKDGTRRELYGKAGAFRPKPYGMEYRVLSNRWLNSPALIRWVYNQAIKGMNSKPAERTYRDLARVIIDENQVDWLDHYRLNVDVDQLPQEVLAA